MNTDWFQVFLGVMLLVAVLFNNYMRKRQWRLNNMTTRTPMIEMRSVSKHFGSVIAISDISMQVYSGEVMCLLGITVLASQR